jgi:hypothetical protein
MALYLHSPIRINAMTLNEAHGQRLLGTSELFFPSEFKLLLYVCIFVCMYVCMYICMYACMCVCMCACIYVCMCVCMHVCIFFFPMALQSQWARLSSLSRLHDHTQTHHIQLISGRVVSPTQRPLPDNTQHSQERDFLASGGIRTLNRSKRATVDPRLRLRGHSRICCLHI